MFAAHVSTCLSPDAITRAIHQIMLGHGLYNYSYHKQRWLAVCSDGSMVTCFAEASLTGIAGEHRGMLGLQSTI